MLAQPICKCKYDIFASQIMSKTQDNHIILHGSDDTSQICGNHNGLRSSTGSQLILFYQMEGNKSNRKYGQQTPANTSFHSDRSHTRRMKKAFCLLLLNCHRVQMTELEHGNRLNYMPITQKPFQQSPLCHTYTWSQSHTGIRV